MPQKELPYDIAPKQFRLDVYAPIVNHLLRIEANLDFGRACLADEYQISVVTGWGGLVYQ